MQRVRAFRLFSYKIRIKIRIEKLQGPSIESKMVQIGKESVDDENLYEKVYLSKKSQDLKNQDSNEPSLTPRQELKKTALNNSKNSLQQLMPNTANSAKMHTDSSIQTLKESINNFKMKFSRSLLNESRTNSIKQETNRCDKIDEPIIYDNTFCMSSTMNLSEASAIEPSENKLVEENESLRDEMDKISK
jgi:hypothetical protein